MVTLCLFNITMENPHFQKVTHDKSSINGYFCIAMFNNQRVKIHLFGAPLREKKTEKGRFEVQQVFFAEAHRLEAGSSHFLWPQVMECI